MNQIPARMMVAIEDYINHGLEPGGFLTAIICNDLRGAVGSADEENAGLLKEYVEFFHNEAPSACWGSRARMDKWIGEHIASDSDTYSEEAPR